VGALVVLVAIQLSVIGLYLPPVLKYSAPYPPQMIISVPVHTAVCNALTVGALVVLIAVQLSVPGLYMPPISKKLPPPTPPHTIISLPVHTAVWSCRPSGGPAVAVHISSMHPPTPSDIAGSM
jgi:hypothetical protein